MKECCVNCFVTKEIELNIELPYRCCLMLGSFLVMVGTIAYFCLCERKGDSVGLVFLPSRILRHTHVLLDTLACTFFVSGNTTSK